MRVVRSSNRFACALLTCTISEVPQTRATATFRSPKWLWLETGVGVGVQSVPVARVLGMSDLGNNVLSNVFIVWGT